MEDCADKVISDGECAAGQNIFFHRKDDKLCGCCISATAIEDSYPFNGELHLYQKDLGENACIQKNCSACSKDDDLEFVVCDEGYKLAFGACFNFEF